MRNPFTRFVLMTFVFLALLATGLAMAIALGGDVVSPPGVVDGVTDAARAGVISSGAGAAASPALQALVAVGLPLLIALIKGWIPEDKRKWIPVLAPILGEVASTLLTNLPHGSGALAGLAAVGLREMKDQHFPAPGDDQGNLTTAGQPVKTASLAADSGKGGGNSNGIVTAAGMAFVILGLVGSLALPLVGTGCAHLDKAGIYHGDKVAYDADAVIDGAYTALDEFITWEAANHTVIAQKWPAISEYARQIADQGDQWVDDVLDLRDAYQANPSAENLSKYQKALNVLSVGLAKVAVYRAQAAGKPAASGHI